MVRPLTMRIRAVASPSNQSNAVGSLELECAPAGLLIVYLGVGAYADGYAPGAVTSGTQVLVPWKNVEEVRALPRHVLLTVTPQLTPHNKLCLTNFREGSGPPEAELKRRRRLLWIATSTLCFAVGFSLATQWDAWNANPGQMSALLVGVAGAVVVLLLGLVADRLLWGQEDDGAQRRFLAEVKLYRPKPVLVGPAAPAASPEPVSFGDLIRFLPRSTLAVIIVLSATTLSVVLTSNWLLRGSERPARIAAAPPPPEPAPPPPAAAAPVPEPEPEPESEPESEPTADDAETVTSGDSCQCQRAESALWGLRFPRLSTLLIEQKSRAHKEHHHLEIELAVINNGNTKIPEVNLLVQFYENEGKTPTKERPLHYGATLRPGQAIKWHVEARGTSFTVHNPIREVIEDDKELADAETFAELLKANHRPVRLHGAMMLAYLGDPRSKGGALKLREALREAEAPYLDRVLATQGDLITCDWRVADSGRVRQMSTCVFNTSGKRLSHIGLKARALDRVFDYRNPVAPPPTVIAEKLVQLDGELAPQEGTIAVVAIDTDNPDGKVPKAFELFADLEELL